MPDKFKDKYRIPSNRLRGWDYSGNGYYYITIVTANRNRLFGEIVNGEMVLNEWGQIVYDELFKSFQLRDELFLGEFVLMPDHLHTIVILDKTKCMDDVTNDDDVRDNDARQCNDARPCNDAQQFNNARPCNDDARPCRDARPCVSTGETGKTGNAGKISIPTQCQRQPKSISSFVAGFKSATVNRIDDWIDANRPAMAKFNKNNPLWQHNYYDRIIRNAAEYRRIADYIVRNPQDWESVEN